jgi:hypothetical protein
MLLLGMYGWGLTDPLGKGHRSDGKPGGWHELRMIRLDMKGLYELLRNIQLLERKCLPITIGVFVDMVVANKSWGCTGRESRGVAS